MNRYIKYLTLALLAVVGVSCIENDIPYPVVKLDVLSLEAEGLKSSPKIDAAWIGKIRADAADKHQILAGGV